MKKAQSKASPKAKTNGRAKETQGGLSPQTDLIYQALETEVGGVDIYTTALECVQRDDLREEWEEYLEQTKRHVEIMRGVCTSLGLDPDRDTPGRQMVRNIGKSLVKTMQMAIGAGDPAAAEIVAAECVVLAETKDHANWSLIGKLAESGSGKDRAILEKAHAEVEHEEDEHLYHTEGWARELWLDTLGLEAQLPPPEEEDDVQSEEEAVRAKQASAARVKNASTAQR